MLCRIVFSSIFLLASVVVVNADPLTLTAGSFVTTRTSDFFTNTGQASGPTISFSGGSTAFECNPPSGCPSTTEGFLSTLIRPNAGNAGTLIIDGVTYDAFVVAFGFNDTTITGVINVFADRNPPLGSSPLFSVEFIGQGFVTSSFNPQSGITRTEFTIATPEPASLLLIGLGVSGLAVRLKRRKRI
ncbi:MAG TPA: PEP-CTERM sorting domain-containing protein [Pyrinomonadaceae bacterium]|nr:PEP-CTERM sorting domain-containing protein [Pyrinomonadaceae bacterium]